MASYPQENFPQQGQQLQQQPPPPPPPPQPKREWWKMTRTIAHYEREIQIGEGTYGQVYRARCKDTGRPVALKKIRVHHGGYWGMPPTVIREIKILKRLQHPRLVEMIEVVSSKGVEHLDEHDEHREDIKQQQQQHSDKKKEKKRAKIDDAREAYKGNLFLVLEYVSHDLTGLLDVAYSFKQVEIKSIFKQLMEGLAYMHENKYVHRDIKSSNILIDSHFRVKLADFGLARNIEPPILDKLHDRGSQQDFTNKVITLWYRPPEILLGATKYGCAVDVWSAGCILAELLLGKPLFTGKTELEQLQLIFDLLGTPTPQSWEGLEDLKLFRTKQVEIGKPRKPRLRDKYGHKMSAPALNLLEKLLELDPSKRLTAQRALASRYFLAEPRAPDNPEELGMLYLGNGQGEFHEFQTKKKRKEVKAIANKAKEEAKERGVPDKEADAIFDQVYREEMKRVAKEGNSALITKEEQEKKLEKQRRAEEKAREQAAAEANKKRHEQEKKEERARHEAEKKDRKRSRRDSEGSGHRRDDQRKKRSRDDQHGPHGGRRSEKRSSRDEGRRDHGTKSENGAAAAVGLPKHPRQANDTKKHSKDDSRRKDRGHRERHRSSGKSSRRDLDERRGHSKDRDRRDRRSSRERSRDRDRHGKRRHHAEGDQWPPRDQGFSPPVGSDGPRGDFHDRRGPLPPEGYDRYGPPPPGYGPGGGPPPPGYRDERPRGDRRRDRSPRRDRDRRH